MQVNTEIYNLEVREKKGIENKMFNSKGPQYDIYNQPQEESPPSSG